MNRIIFAPQFPAGMRYQEWWFNEFPKQFRKYFDEVIVLGEEYFKAFFDARPETGSFSPMELSVDFEGKQISQFLKLKIYPEDIFFLSDLSFPGFFSNILYHKKPKNCFAFCHATSKNSLDYFAPVRKSKWLAETAHSKLFKKVFIATEYHKRRLGWKNVEIVGLPDSPFDGYKLEKKFNIISVARSNIQKVNKQIEAKVESKFGKIERANCGSWIEYYKFLSQGKVLLSTAKEETFGYQILEAIKNNTIPIAPDRFSYPELLPKEYLYKNIEQLNKIINLALSGKLDVPSLLNQNLVSSFFENICSIMKKECNG